MDYIFIVGKLAGLSDPQDESSFALSGSNNYGLAIVMGPHHHTPSIFIQSLCELHDIPQISIRRELDFQHDPVRSINFYPDTETLAKVYIFFYTVIFNA